MEGCRKILSASAAEERKAARRGTKEARTPVESEADPEPEPLGTLEDIRVEDRVVDREVQGLLPRGPVDVEAT